MRTIPGRFIAAGGALLVCNAVGVDKNSWKSLLQRTPWFGKRQDDPVHDASADSFPASDPPAWTPVAGSTPHPHGLDAEAR
jgi:hypothetical protein